MGEGRGGEWVLERPTEPSISRVLGGDGADRAKSRHGVEPIDEVTRDSYDYCHQVTRQRARNFYYGLRLTPQPKRSALYVIYAFMRACDDLVDIAIEGHRDTQESAAVGASRVEAFRAKMRAVLEGRVARSPQTGEDLVPRLWPAFEHVVQQYRLDPTLFELMLQGQEQDLVQHHYETFDQLYDYCYKVASVVGLVCIEIWGPPPPDAPPEAPPPEIGPGGADPKAASWAGSMQLTRKLAEYRGIAFQMTNILRDVVEDARRGRLYLPLEDLRRFGLDDDPQRFMAKVVDGEPGTGFDDLMRFEADRAQAYYDRAAGLEQRLDPTCWATSWAMTRIYQGLLKKIRAAPRAVLRKRVRLSSLQKARIALGAAWRR